MLRRLEDTAADGATRCRIDVEESRLRDLRMRLQGTRWLDLGELGRWDYGVPDGYLRAVFEYWRDDYNWRDHERGLNQWPHFVREIDGQVLHYIHVRARHPRGLPLLLTHGWPGSVVEFLGVLPRLSEHHDVVVPSLPGFTLSGRTREGGWDVDRIARAWAELMAQLGYPRYGAQGGDWGSLITIRLALHDPDHLVAAHVNMLHTPAPRDADTLASLTEQDRSRLQDRRRYDQELSGYHKLQSTRPHTLGWALNDSPVGQLAWIVDCYREWSDCGGDPRGALGLDRMLTNVMLYWLTETAASSARLYRESRHLWSDRTRPKVPFAVAVYPKDLFLPVRSLADQQLHVVAWQEMPRGGHFAAWEEPELFVDDVRGFFAQFDGVT